MRLLTGILDRIFVVTGAFLFAQMPIYIQLYTQRLAGHTAELSFQIDQLKKSAMVSGKTLDQYTHKFVSNTDPDFSLQGEWMLQLISRWENLKQAAAALQEATLFSRPFQFFHYFNLEIAKPALEEFEPGLPLTLEGGAYALLGVAFGYLFFRSFSQLMNAILGKFKNRLAANRV